MRAGLDIVTETSEFLDTIPNGRPGHAEFLGQEGAGGSGGAPRTKGPKYQRVVAQRKWLSVGGRSLGLNWPVPSFRAFRSGVC